MFNLEFSALLLRECEYLRCNFPLEERQFLLMNESQCAFILAHVPFVACAAPHIVHGSWTTVNVQCSTFSHTYAVALVLAHGGL